MPDKSTNNLNTHTPNTNLKKFPKINPSTATQSGWEEGVEMERKGTENCQGSRQLQNPDKLKCYNVKEEINPSFSTFCIKQTKIKSQHRGAQGKANYSVLPIKIRNACSSDAYVGR